MGVLIRGMEMPKTCHECRLYEGDIYYCSAADKEIDISDSSEGKCQFCPLVPVPPHGDLIDYNFCIENYELLHDDGNPVYAVRIRDIINAPTIIPAEEGE